ncbi:MAG TPA: lytic murein transglycosylase, partial [Caulobacteraceae bacterium]|nr:lytic murein transglycosylase [Caulobacteraceae bacterium]
MHRRHFLAASLTALVAAPSFAAQAPGPIDEAGFESWRDDFIERASLAGLPRGILTREFEGLTLDPKVVALDSQQPEFSRPISDYIDGLTSDARVNAGKARRAGASWLSGVETRYGTPSEVLVAIWSVESSFGVMQGDFDVLRSVASLAAEGRRRDWAEDQIGALIHIIASGEATRAQLKGSWAGAMGQTQLEPTAYLDDAVDVSGGGRPDVWGSPQDALASAANLLAKAGWRRGEAWQREARLPGGFDYGLAEGPAKSVAAWSELGVKPAVGDSFGEHAPEAVLLLPAGA